MRAQDLAQSGCECHLQVQSNTIPYSCALACHEGVEPSARLIQTLRDELGREAFLKLLPTWRSKTIAAVDLSVRSMGVTNSP